MDGYTPFVFNESTLSNREAEEAGALTKRRARKFLMVFHLVERQLSIQNAISLIKEGTVGTKTAQCIGSRIFRLSAAQEI